MALVILRLKLAILRRGRGRGGAAQRVWFILSWAVAVVLGLAVGGGLAAAASMPGARGDLVVVLAGSLLVLGWVLTPLLAPGLSDQVVDPARLEQFPLTRRQQVGGLLLAGLVSPAAAFTVLVSAGGTAAAGEPWQVRLVVAALAVLTTVFCVAASRTVQAVLAGALTSRRGRELVIVLGGALGVGMFALAQRVTDVTSTLSALQHGPTQTVLGWLPSGALAQAGLSARDGDWPAVLLRALLVTAGLVVVLWIWGHALGARVRGRAVGLRPRSHPAAATQMDLVPPPLSALPAGPAVAAAAQQLRYYFFRSPQALQGGIFPLLLAVFVAHTMVQPGDLALAAIGLAAIGGAIGTLFLDVLAYDDRGFTFLVWSGAPMRRVLAGKVLVAVLPLSGLLLVFLVVEATLTRAWTSLLPSLLLGIGMLLLASGVGAVASVLAPHNRVSREFNKGAALLTVFAGLAAVLVVAVVVVLVAQVLNQVVGELASSLGVVALGVLGAWVGLRWAGRHLDCSQPRVLRALGL